MNDSQAATAIPLDYNGQPEDSRIVAEELDGCLRLTIQPFGGLWDIRWVLRALGPLVISLIVYVVAARFFYPALSLNWHPMMLLIILPVFLYAGAVWVVGSSTTTVELLRTGISIRTTTGRWTRARSFERDQVGSVTVSRLAGEICVRDKRSRALCHLRLAHTADLAWLATVLRSRLNLQDQP